MVVPTRDRDLYRGVYRAGFVVGQGRGEYRVPISIWPENGNDAMLTAVLVPRWQPRFYHFTPQGLNTIVQETLSSQSVLQNLPIENLNTTILLTDLLERIKVAYPDTQVQTDFLDRDEWVWNNAGGAMGSMYIIHASITE